MSKMESRVSSPYDGSLYYMSALENLGSILQRGILLKSRVLKERIGHRSIANASVQDLRAKVYLGHDGNRRRHHDYVPLYLCAPTPMLYSRRDQQDDIVYIDINPKVLELPGVILADGNAANQGLHQGIDGVEVTVAAKPGERCQRAYLPNGRMPTKQRKTEFYLGPDGLEHLPWEIMRLRYWLDGATEAEKDERRRQKHAEALIPDCIPPRLFLRIHVRTTEGQRRAAATIDQIGGSTKVAVSPALYFNNAESAMAMNFEDLSGDLGDVPFDDWERVDELTDYDEGDEYLSS